MLGLTVAIARRIIHLAPVLSPLWSVPALVCLPVVADTLDLPRADIVHVHGDLNVSQLVNLAVFARWMWRHCTGRATGRGSRWSFLLLLLARRGSSLRIDVVIVLLWLATVDGFAIATIVDSITPIISPPVAIGSPARPTPRPVVIAVIVVIVIIFIIVVIPHIVAIVIISPVVISTVIIPLVIIPFKSCTIVVSIATVAVILIISIIIIRLLSLLLLLLTMIILSLVVSIRLSGALA